MAVDNSANGTNEASHLSPEQWGQAFALLMQSVQNLLQRVKKLEGDLVKPNEKERGPD